MYSRSRYVRVRTEYHDGTRGKDGYIESNIPKGHDRAEEPTTGGYMRPAFSRSKGGWTHHEPAGPAVLTVGVTALYPPFGDQCGEEAWGRRWRVAYEERITHFHPSVR